MIYREMVNKGEDERTSQEANIGPILMIWSLVNHGRRLDKFTKVII
jgi:hypothetical protein